MQTVVIVIHLMIVVAMIGLVLLQRSEGGGLGIGGGGGFMTNRGTANVLTRATAMLAAVFFATSLVLSLLAGFDRKPTVDPRHRRAGADRPGSPDAARHRRRRARHLARGRSGGPERAAGAAVAIRCETL